uniref:DUF834 domain-containing protein n=1 Tax=Oryza punctata TaxID=4537 RepID=A0A0E0M5F2_ORYPU
MTSAVLPSPKSAASGVGRRASPVARVGLARGWVRSRDQIDRWPRGGASIGGEELEATKKMDKQG